MEKNESYYQDLLDRYLRNKLSVDKANEIFDFIRQQPELAAKLLQESGNEDYINHISTLDLVDEATSRRMLDKLLGAIAAGEATQKPVSRMFSKWWYAAAAIFILLLGISILIFQNKTKLNKDISAKQPVQNDVLPGGNKATLTLANGKKIILDSAVNGLLAEQGNTKITKTTNGQLAYNTLTNTSTEKPVEIVYNVLTTPKGGQYQIKLPDGTDVWLNSASSITYPTAFMDKERDVTITGEAYFEVAKDKAKPFHVKVNDMEVKVLGTHFNINAYNDEMVVKTTLLEGSVRISVPGSEALIKPGQQAAWVRGGKIDFVKDVNTGDVVAWKTGMFSFHKEDIKSIMRQVARWYDVNVQFNGTIEKHFNATIDRDVPISKLLNYLEGTEDVHFKIKDKTIVVYP